MDPWGEQTTIIVFIRHCIKPTPSDFIPIDKVVVTPVMKFFCCSFIAATFLLS